MNNWNINKGFEEKMTPYIDKIYKKHLGNDIEVSRSTRENQTDKTLFADRHLAIDTFIRFSDGQTINVQEKSRQFRFLEFNDFTIQHYKNAELKTEGYWFYLMAQLYFFGIANENNDGYEKYYILNVVVLRIALKSLDTEWLMKLKRNNQKSTDSDFIPIPFETIEELDKKFNGLILYKSDDTDN
jgi:hypothetical protein